MLGKGAGASRGPALRHGAPRDDFCVIFTIIIITTKIIKGAGQSAARPRRHGAVRLL